jgi:precorrin-2/cobalt-factor-2 C20-methyltransferase
VPLTTWQEQLHVIPARQSLHAKLDQPGTYVLMKSGSRMAETKKMLADSGRRVRMVENCGMPDERIYQNLEEIPDDAGYFSLIVAKEP